MNDFELSYIHKARSKELIAEAARERQSREARKADGKHREGLAARVSGKLRRKEASAPSGARRFQLAK